jgi:hypothetical protein
MRSLPCRLQLYRDDNNNVSPHEILLPFSPLQLPAKTHATLELGRSEDILSAVASELAQLFTLYCMYEAFIVIVVGLHSTLCSH